MTVLSVQVYVGSPHASPAAARQGSPHHLRHFSCSFSGVSTSLKSSSCSHSRLQKSSNKQLVSDFVFRRVRGEANLS